MNEPKNHGALVLTIIAIIIIVFAFWVNSRPNTQQIAPQGCELVGNC